jgi:hypothetical protein
MSTSVRSTADFGEVRQSFDELGFWDLSDTQFSSKPGSIHNKHDLVDQEV